MNDGFKENINVIPNLTFETYEEPVHVVKA